ncbi:uncharacterized protein MELLADRAFT_124199 [Melampsora larici-populina 98AG31]|uniref:Secreted protein n=1 Tax=Melampsora larici-populina (strain 98AG31 / pathotype 3-4-7) TaxID=747676 RepID=F4R6X3_MELLP|nr:uncharacterized protein MELLADRAFT_124199 [Melampsora larici-populina 98AG31]EGG12379.1 secreted protein [Melampsora larici-populina 98AG31]
MRTYITIPSFVLIITAWRSVSASITCGVSWNAVTLEPGQIACQAGDRHYSCKLQECWVGDPPARDDSKYNVMDHIFFEDCHKYKDKFGDSKQEKDGVRVQASRYWSLVGKSHPHFNVIGHEAEKDVPTELPGYRCNDIEAVVPECRRESCQLMENAHW